MRPCDLCGAAVIARFALLGGRSDRRTWLCEGCFGRLADYDLSPGELLALTRLAARRLGRCEWCAERPPAAQVRVPGADGRQFSFQLCEPCAGDAARESGGRVLAGEAAIAGDTTVDPRYERALEVDRRRRAIRRVK